MVDAIASGQTLDSVQVSQQASDGGFLAYNVYKTVTLIDNYINFGKVSNFLGYKRADLKISWPFWLFDNVILKIGTGACFGYLTQGSRSTYFLQNLPVNDPNFFSAQGYYTSMWQGTWWGGGLLFTGDVNFDIGYGLGVYIDTSAAFMFGKEESKERWVSGDYNDNTQYSNDYQYQPVVKVGSGLRYDRWFGPVQLYTSAGWEFNYWWYGALDFASLTFTGLSARLGVAY
jgi:hypothetical protein